jgi:hypothetical protein
MATDAVRRESFAVGERSRFESVLFSVPVVSPETTAAQCVGASGNKVRTQENLARGGRLTLDGARSAFSNPVAVCHPVKVA